jgi:hypothetical protein
VLVFLPRLQETRYLSIHIHTPKKGSEYSIADFVSKVNPADGHFLKYLPDGFLSKEQISSKRIALEEDRRRIEGYEKTYLRAKDDMENQQTADDSRELTLADLRAMDE